MKLNVSAIMLVESALSAYIRVTMHDARVLGEISESLRAGLEDDALKATRLRDIFKAALSANVEDVTA